MGRFKRWMERQTPEKIQAGAAIIGLIGNLVGRGTRASAVSMILSKVPQVAADLKTGREKLKTYIAEKKATERLEGTEPILNLTVGEAEALDLYIKLQSKTGRWLKKRARKGIDALKEL